jgi:methionine biosynthesis protein MetW
MNATQRADLDVIAGLVASGARALDLGCGDGTLLERLEKEKGVKARGVELSEESVRAAIRRGLSVRHGNIEEGLADYPDGSMDYVILSQTLAYLDNPARVVGEMLRVARHAVISFSNAGHWRARLDALKGKGMGAPLASGQPRERSITLPQFEEFCRKVGAAIEQSVFLAGTAPVRFRPDLFANVAVYVITKQQA